MSRQGYRRVRLRVVTRGLLRMIDANSNRAAEALRTLEDVARFISGSGFLANRLKSIRHRIRATVAEVGSLELAASRDAPHDPLAPRALRGPQASRAPLSAEPAGAGTAARDAADDPSSPPAPGVPGEDESHVPPRSFAVRRNVAEIALAASSRAGEALRSLEEALRALRPDLAARIERLRFMSYDASAKVTLAVGTGRARQWRLCLLLTESLCRRPWEEVLRATLDAGADCIQIREKSLGDRELFERARQVIDLARPRGASVIVNDRADVALAAEADGVHLGTGDLPIHAVRALGGALLVGASTHDLDEAAAAVDAGADYCGVGAMFPTSTKPEREPSGAAFLSAFVARHPRVPHLAIGGVTAERVAGLVAAGGRGVAVGAAICGADDPGAAARAILEPLEHAVEVRA